MANKNKNKVEFGISNLHVGTYTVDSEGHAVLGTPYHQKGAVSFSPEEQSERTDFFADNISYWNEYTGGKIEGDIEVALFDDDFKTNYLGYKRLKNGGLAKVKNPVKPDVYIAFEVAGDADNRRVILYNCSLGVITREYNTEEEQREPATETLPITATGDNASGVTMASFVPEDDGYDDLFTNPSAPELEEESE